MTWPTSRRRLPLARSVIASLLGSIMALLLSSCGGREEIQKPPDTELVKFERGARQAFEIRSFERAAHFYGRALDRARVMDDPKTIGDNAYNLAACQLTLGQIEPALHHVSEARSAYGRLGQTPADVDLLEANILHHGGQPREARRQLDGLLARNDVEAEHILQARLMLSRIAVDTEDFANLDKDLDALKDDVEDASDARISASFARLRGEHANYLGRHDDAARLFDEEVDHLRSAGAYREMASALLRAGQAYDGAGQHSDAADRYFRAGRSYLSQDDDETSARCAMLCLQAARAAGLAYQESRALWLESRLKERNGT